MIFTNSKKEEEEEEKVKKYVFAAVLFKTAFLVELGIGLLFPEGTRRSEKN